MMIARTVRHRGPLMAAASDSRLPSNAVALELSGRCSSSATLSANASKDAGKSSVMPPMPNTPQEPFADYYSKAFERRSNSDQAWKGRPKAAVSGSTPDNSQSLVPAETYTAVAQRLNRRLSSLIPQMGLWDNQSSAKSKTDPFPPQIRHAITLRTLMAANLHLGHAAGAFNRNMLTFIHGKRAGIHIINLEHTLVQLRRAINITREIAMRGGIIVFVGTKKSLHKITLEAAERAGGYFVTRWTGGTLTNKERVLRRSTGFDPDKIAQVLAKTSDADGPIALDNSVGGGRPGGSRPGNRQPGIPMPDLIVILDMPNNLAAVREANQMNIPVIAICDTDCDPTVVPYPIAANDDSVVGVQLIAGVLSRASTEGRKFRKSFK